MRIQAILSKSVCTWTIALVFCSSLHAYAPKNSEKPDGVVNSDTTAVQYAVDCAKTCFATVGAAGASVAGFLGFAGATCSAGVCPMVVATGTSGLLTASGLTAAVSAFVVSAGEVCAEGVSLQCMAYVAVPAVVGGFGGYLVIKGYDKARKWYARRQAMAYLEAEEEALALEEVAEFVPEKEVN